MRARARAPVRVDPGGGGTDAPPFSVEHGGRVVNFAVQRHAWALAERLPAGAGVHIWSSDLGRGVSAPAVEALPASGPLEFVCAFVRRLVPPEESVLLVTDSDVPPGSGLGGSGALGVAVVAALDEAWGRRRTPAEVAALANAVERGDLGYPGGSQDSYGSALGGVNVLEYPAGRDIEPRSLTLSREIRLGLERASLLIYTGAAHVSGSIHEDIRTSYAEEGSATRRAMFDLRDEAAVLAECLESGDLEGYARSLDVTCEHLYRLHPSCDSEDHRRVHEALRDIILGRKTCGAGGGGFLLVHARRDARKECVRRAEALGATVWPLSLDFEGVVTWREPPSSAAELSAWRQRIAAAG